MYQRPENPYAKKKPSLLLGVSPFSQPTMGVASLPVATQQPRVGFSQPISLSHQSQHVSFSQPIPTTKPVNLYLKKNQSSQKPAAPGAPVIVNALRNLDLNKKSAPKDQPFVLNSSSWSDEPPTYLTSPAYLANVAQRCEETGLSPLPPVPPPTRRPVSKTASMSQTAVAKSSALFRPTQFDKSGESSNSDDDEESLKEMAERAKKGAQKGAQKAATKPKAAPIRRTTRSMSKGPQKVPKATKKPPTKKNHPRRREALSRRRLLPLALLLLLFLSLALALSCPLFHLSLNTPTASPPRLVTHSSTWIGLLLRAVLSHSRTSRTSLLQAPWESRESTQIRRFFGESAF